MADEKMDSKEAIRFQIEATRATVKSLEETLEKKQELYGISHESLDALKVMLSVDAILMETMLETSEKAFKAIEKYMENRRKERFRL